MGDLECPLLFLYHPKLKTYQSLKHPILWVVLSIETPYYLTLTVRFKGQGWLDYVTNVIHSIFNTCIHSNCVSTSQQYSWLSNYSNIKLIIKIPFHGTSSLKVTLFQTIKRTLG